MFIVCILIRFFVFKRIKVFLNEKYLRVFYFFLERYICKNIVFNKL